MDSKWLALIIPAASSAVLLFGLAATSFASVAQSSATQPIPASDQSGFCATTSAAIPEVELCTATAKPPEESEAKVCPITGARGKSSLHLEEVMERVHRDVGACPHKARKAASNCPYLRDKEQAPARTATQRPQGTWL